MKKIVKKVLENAAALFVCAVLASALPALPAFAQADGKTPPLPAPIQNLVEQGAQVRYLGNRFGLDGWIAIQGGQEQYFYVTEGGEGFVMGLLFDKQGKMQTMRQVAALQKESGTALDPFASVPSAEGKEAASSAAPSTPAFKTPAEQLFDDVSHSNWVPLGDPSAPVVYSFIDPLCPHCHDLVQDLRKNYIDKGRVQLRMIPVGFKEGSMERAAFLLAVPEPQARWYRHLDGDPDALPVTPGINDQGVQRNMAIMQSWKFNVTPLTVYRARDGQVKIVEGRVRDPEALAADLPPPGTVKNPPEGTPAGKKAAP